MTGRRSCAAATRAPASFAPGASRRLTNSWFIHPPQRDMVHADRKPTGKQETGKKRVVWVMGNGNGKLEMKMGEKEEI